MLYLCDVMCIEVPLCSCGDLYRVCRRAAYTIVAIWYFRSARSGFCDLCMSHSLRQNTVRRYAKCILRVIYPRRPTVPNIGEWTSCVSSVRFAALGVINHGIHRLVFNKSVGFIPKHVRTSQELQLVPATGSAIIYSDQQQGFWDDMESRS